MHLIDTNVAIYLRDLDDEILDRVRSLPTMPKMSLLSWVELESGVAAQPELADQRRIRLDRLLARFTIIDLDPPIVDAYRTIIAATGFSRRRIIDRLIAATAIGHGLTLITINGSDFAGIPNLKLEIWPAPSAQ